MEWLDDSATALRRAWRSLKRTPGFVVIAVGMLALALGLATAVIAEVDSLLHPSFGSRYADRIYFMTLRQFSGARRVFPGAVTREMTLPAVRRTPGVEAATVTSFGENVLPDYFSVLGVDLQLGRTFTADETAESGVVIVSDRVWRRELHSTPSLDSAVLRNGSVQYRVVGVLPAGASNLAEHLLHPMPAAPFPWSGANSTYLLRMRAGTTEADAQRAMATVAAELTAQAGDSNRVEADTRLLKPDPMELSQLHYALIGASLFVLLIACANTSALMLARSVARRRDQALRIALGAGRGVLLREVIAEVAILGLLGGVGGLVIAEWAMRLLVSQLTLSAGFVEPRWSFLVFALLLAIVVAAIALAAAVPAWYVTHIQPAEPLKDRSSGTTSRPSRRFQILIVGELALSMTLLLGTALMAKSIGKIETFDFGYDPRGLVQVSLGTTVLPLTEPSRTIAARAQPPRREITPGALEAAVSKVRSLPGILGAAWFEPFSPEQGVLVSDATVAQDTALYKPVMFNVGPGFMQTLGLRITAGRDFLEGDQIDEGAAIVDQRAAEILFPRLDPIGSMVKLGREVSDAPWTRVVGVVPHALHSLPYVAELVEVDPEPSIYITRQTPGGNHPRIVVRTDPEYPKATLDVVDALVALMPPGAEILTNDWIPQYATQINTRRVAARIFSTLSIASLILAIAGLFGVLSYIVGQRMRDFAIRSALGATRTHIVGHVARDAFVMALGGTALGAFVGFGAGFAVYEWLWGVYPVDAEALVIAEAILLTSAVVASILPAIRGTRANPVEVMRAV